MSNCCTVYDATCGDPPSKTAEVSLAELRQILKDGSARIVDTRKISEFAAGHIPGAHCITSTPNQAAAEPVALVERLVAGDKAAKLVLYCNGPFCKGTRRLSEQLFDAGFTGVRRFQLGIPVWRALGGPTEVELDGLRRIYKIDGTAVLFDCRPIETYAHGSLAGAHNVTVAMAMEGLDRLPLPRDDFHTRVVLFGSGAGEARALADILSTSPFHNVLYFSGPFEHLMSLTAGGR
jgi:rhodanese-related sulfurtransferase